MGLTIRSKVLLLSLTFFSIPYVGYEYVLEMEKYLRDSLETSLKDTARALANVLHNQPELFDRQLPELIEYYTPTAELRNFRTAFRLDGNTSDWQDYWEDLRTFDYNYSLSSQPNWQREDFYFQYVAGTYRNYLYSLFIVNDNDIVYRNPGDLALNTSDNLQIMLQDVDGYVHRYVVAPSTAGWVNAYRASPGSNLLSDSERRIQGVWSETETGYIIEIRIPLNILGERFAFVINNIDNLESPILKASIANVGINQDNNGDIYLNSAKITNLIHGLGNAPGRRVWVLDKYQRVLALHGDLYRELPEHPLNDIFTMLLPPVSETLGENQRGDGLYHTQVKHAISGKSDVRWHSSQDEKTVIVSAVYPVIAANNVIGAVMVEETNLSIQTVQRQAIANLFNKTLVLFTITTLLLLIFASRLSIRLRRLRNAAETAIDINGRVTVTKIGSDAQDEIGDLSRSFSNILQKLHQYNKYLEGMASRLSHELRTPIAVVRSSLENLELEHKLSPESVIYMERAKQGIERLNTTITRLSEATRLEQSLQHAERERLDLKELINSCIAGYRLAYPDRSFQAHLPNETAMAYVAPDLIAQMLDKLVSNAHDFAEANTAIRIELMVERNMLRLSILNRGVTIPHDMKTHLFNSMVSLRQTTDAKEPHLGLGLYMVRLIANYHGGQAKALDHPDGNGAMFSVWLPQSEV